MITDKTKELILEAVALKQVVTLAEKTATEASFNLGEARRAWENHQAKFDLDEFTNDKVVEIEGKTYLVVGSRGNRKNIDVKEVVVDSWKERKKPL